MVWGWWGYIFCMHPTGAGTHPVSWTSEQGVLVFFARGKVARRGVYHPPPYLGTQLNKEYLHSPCVPSWPLTRQNFTLILLQLVPSTIRLLVLLSFFFIFISISLFFSLFNWHLPFSSPQNGPHNMHVHIITFNYIRLLLVMSHLSHLNYQIFLIPLPHFGSKFIFC